MNSRGLLLLLGFAWIAPAQDPGCIQVEGDRIVARDLAPSLPVFGNAPPDALLAATPSPGVRRVFRSFEVAAWAKRNGLEALDAKDVCFERRMEKLDRNQMLDAMRAALGIANVRIEIVETSTGPVPRGRLEFRRESLHAPALRTSRTPVEWSGNVVYGDNRRFAVWAKVVVSALVPRVVAVGSLKRGEPITAEQVHMESMERFPLGSDVAQSVNQVVGRVPLHSFADGEEIRLNELLPQPDVTRGEMVAVEVRSGAARLKLTAKAETSGRSGDNIMVRNLSSNKVFQARINGKGRAFVDAARFQGN